MKSATFSIREYAEVVALKTIIQFIRESGPTEIYWRVFSSSVNTDFNFYSLSLAFAGEKSVSIIGVHELQEKETVCGFSTDMQHVHDQYVTHFFDCSAVVACRLYRRLPLKIPSIGRKTVVIGNVKVKSPVEDFQIDVFRVISELPYRVVVVPRHPLTKDEMKRTFLPKGIDFRNSMGELEGLYATADLGIMGRIFCADGLQPNDDHNPLEATINAHAICGINNKIPEAYRWLYENSDLVHQCETYEQVFGLIETLTDDRDVLEKLQKRQEWILENRHKYLEPIRDVILSLAQS